MSNEKKKRIKTKSTNSRQRKQSEIPDIPYNRARDLAVQTTITEGLIKDKKAYKKYQKMMKFRIVKSTIRTASDGREYNLAKLPHHLRKDIEGLPRKERKMIMKKKQLYFKIFNNAQKFKRLAFGIRFGRPVKGTEGSLSLLDNRKEEIVELFGRMYSAEEVHTVIVKEWQIPCSYTTVTRFRKRYMEVICEKIENHKISFADVRLGYKRSRLDELSYLYKVAKEKYLETKNHRDLEQLIKLIDAIRREVEGDTLRIDGKIDMTIDNKVQSHLQNEVFKEISINQIIMARVASKMGQSPLELINRLTDSYYKRFAGLINKPIGEEDNEDFNDFQEVNSDYDFDKIKKNHEKEKKNKKIEEENKKTTAVVLSNKKGEEKDDFRKRLLEKIANQNKMLMQQNIDVNVASERYEHKEKEKKVKKKD